MVFRGRVSNGVVLLPSATGLPDGTLVEITPVSSVEVSSERSEAAPYRVSIEQREALLSLIGIWKTGQPPGDEEVERIVDEYRMKKHG